MKRMMGMAIVVVMLAGAGSAYAQSLGDYARDAKKNKPQTSAASRHYDNDNLPTKEQLSIVGPAASEASANGSPNAAATASPSATATKAESEQANSDLQNKIDAEKQKLDALNHEFDLEQREYRLRAATFYADAGNRLRDSGKWDKADAQYKSDLDSKQKDAEAARQKLEELQEEARKNGLPDKPNPDDKEASKENPADKEVDKDKGKDQDKP